MNLKEKLLALSNPKPIKLELAELGDGYYLRILTVGAIMEQQADTKDIDNKVAVARAVARVLVDKDNAPIFDVENQDDVKAVLQLPWPLIKRIMESGNKANGVEQEKGAPNA